MFNKWRKHTTIPILSSALFLAGCSVPLVAAAKHKTAPAPSVPASHAMPSSLMAGHNQFHTTAYDGDTDSKSPGSSDVDKPPKPGQKASNSASAASSAKPRTQKAHSTASATAKAKPKPPLKPVTVPLFHLHTKKNMQGVTAYGGHVYAAFDLGHGKGEIREYTLSGQLVKNSGPLPIGHSASLSYNQANGLIYVTNGGQTHSTKISEVNMSLKHPKVIRSVNLGAFGHSGLVAIDNATHRMWVHTAANDHAPITFRYCTMTGKVLKHFTIPNQGVPQGLQVYHGRLYYYTDNQVTVLSENGQILRTLHVRLGGESEGLALVHGTKPYLILGFHSPNRYYVLKNVIPS